MSTETAKIEPKPDTSPKPVKTDKSIPDLKTPAGLKAAGFVVEVTAKNPDNKIYDFWHHPCTLKTCTHDRSTVAQWVLLPAQDPKKCVNPKGYKGIQKETKEK